MTNFLPKPLINAEALSESQLELIDQIKATRKGMSILQVHKAITKLDMRPELFVALTERNIIKTTRSGRYIYPEPPKRSKQLRRQ